MKEKERETVILFPDFERLEHEVKELRSKLAALILQRDELRFWEAPKLKMEYMLQLGAIEYKICATDFRLFCFNRKEKKLRERKDFREKLTMEEIERSLNEEFNECRERLHQKMVEMDDVLKRRKERVLSDNEIGELKKRYRQVVEVLHPDLHPNLKIGQEELFRHAGLAYQQGDLITLSLIAEMVSFLSNISVIEECSMTLLVDEKNRLERCIAKIQESLEQLQQEYPFTVKDLLSDAKKVASQKLMLEDKLYRQEQKIHMHRKRI